MEPTFISIDRQAPIAIIRLNRPKALNAIHTPMMTELVEILECFDNDPDIRCSIITGNDRAFAAGADIMDMANASAVEMIRNNPFACWDRVAKIRKPLIAAVSGYTLGGGLELTLMCDMIVASETAVFGQPETSLGIIPGVGGTQRLTRIIGKSLAMEMVLAGRRLTAQEALNAGLVNKVASIETYLNEAKKMALAVAERPPLAVQLAKESILKTMETTLNSGLDFERKCFYLLFASEDQKEGMKAFLEKRPADFQGK